MLCVVQAGVRRVTHSLARLFSLDNNFFALTMLGLSIQYMTHTLAQHNLWSFWNFHEFEASVTGVTPVLEFRHPVFVKRGCMAVTPQKKTQKQMTSALGRSGMMFACA